MIIDHDAAWAPDDACAGRVPPALLPWLAEPALLSDRVRTASRDAARFRLLSEGPVTLAPGARRRLGVDSDVAHERRGEFHVDGNCWIATQSLFPRSTLDRHPWLVEIGGALLGERLKTAGSVSREPFEYLELPADHALSLPPHGGPQRHERAPRAWARRAVHRIDGVPILVTEVFSPRVVTWTGGSAARDAASTSRSTGPTGVRAGPTR